MMQGVAVPRPDKVEKSRPKGKAPWTRTFQAAFLAVLSFGGALQAGAAEPSLAATDLPRVRPTAPDKVLGTFKVKPGFKMELVASEPLVVDPIAMSFDENGRLFVVEMRDYSERRDEHLGRIRLLEDTNGDGRFDKSTVFAEGLAWPTAVICSNGGLFVGSSPDIFFLKDTNGDGASDVRELVFTGFGAGVEKLNVQALLNSFTWGLDNRIHGATAGNGGKITSPKNPGGQPLELRGRDFSFDPRTLDIRSETGGGQYGLSFDDRGRKFVCSNSAHIQTLMYDDSETARNPFYTLPNPLVNIAVDGPAAEVYRLSPDEPWRVIRTKWRVSGLVPGPIEGGGRASGYFTAATGITIYRGNAWPAEYRGNAIVADCGSNLIHRKKVFPDGAGFLAKRPDDELKSEFIASTDNWFRPVQFANAPDGALYVADMYRETIEHPWSLPQSIKQYLDLNSGNDRGRIYRIVPDGFRQPKLPRLGSATTAELVKALEHPNGWHRDTAARLLYERRDLSAVAAVEKLLDKSSSELGRLHALYALAGLGRPEPPHLARALSDSAPAVREHAVRLCANLLPDRGGSPALLEGLVSLASDPEPRVRYQLALALGRLPMKEAYKATALATIAVKDLSDPWIRAAILNSLGEAADFSFFRSVATKLDLASKQQSESEAQNARAFLGELIRLIAVQKRKDDIALVVSYLKDLNHPGQSFLLGRALLDGLRRASMDVSALDGQTQSRWKIVAETARTSAGDDRAPVEQRLPAIQLLGALKWAETGKLLSSLLNTSQPQPVQLAAVTSLTQFREPEAARALIGNWPQLTPRLRSDALSALLSRPQQIPVLLEGIENNAVQRAELSPAQIDRLRSHRDRAIAQRAAKVFPTVKSEDREKILQSFLPSLNLAGDAARGKKIYVERCSSCHRQGGEGYAVGPDFASVKSNGKEKLLTSLIDPNREVAPSYLNYAVETKDGESLMGLIVNDNVSSVTLRRAFGDESVVPRSNIQKIQSMSLSVMPEGLEAELSHQAMADLLEFMVSDAPAKP